MGQTIGAYIRRHHLGLIAIFVALTGTAYAATAAKNSVTSRSIKNGGVKLNDLAGNSVDGSKVVDNSLTGADILESSLQGIVGEQGIQGPPGPSTGPAGGDLTGSYPDPTIGDGKVTADKFANLPAAAVSITCASAIAYQTIPGDGTLTPLSFSAERFDTANMASVNAACDAPNRSRLTAPRSGVYAVDAAVVWSNSAPATGSRFLGIRVSGSSTYVGSRIPDVATSADAPENSVSLLVRLVQGDYVEAVVSQDSGSPILLDQAYPRDQLSMHWVSPCSGC